MKYKLIITAFLAVLGLAFAVPAAHANQPQICGNGGSGYCLNSSGGGSGNGNPVIMWYGNSNYEDFVAGYVNECSGNHFVQATIDGDPINCPFATVALDNYWRGQEIVALQYIPGSGECVASGGSSKAVLGTCPNGSGGGGSNGVIDIFYGPGFGGCGASNQGYLINRFNSDYYGSNAFLQSGGSLGAQAYFYVETTGTCWGFS